MNIPAENHFYCQSSKELIEVLKHPERVRSLAIEKINDEDLLAQVVEFTALEKLRVRGCSVESLLANIGQLSKLRSLSLDMREVHWPRLPKPILELDMLTELALERCGLKTLEGISRMKGLKTLETSNQPLDALPEEIADVPLEVLNLGRNNLVCLPTRFSEMTTLRRVNFSLNKLEELPANFGNLAKLELVFLQYNRLKTLPASLGDLTAVKYIDLQHNSFESLPSELEALARRAESFKLESQFRPLFMDWTYQPAAKLPVLSLEDMDLMAGPQEACFQDMAAGMAAVGVPDYTPRINKAMNIITTDPDDYSRVGCSRLGGFPDLANEADYPRTDDGKFWCFLAQINCAEAAAHNPFLPREGLLLFFVPSTQNDKAKVLFYEGDLSRLKTVRIDTDELLNTDDMIEWKPHRVRFEAGTDIRYQIFDEEETMGIFENYFDKYSSSAEHAMNSLTSTQHETPAELAANAFRGETDEWLELISLGFDSNVGFCFGDAGVLTIPIHREDLRRHDFSKVGMMVESS